MSPSLAGGGLSVAITGQAQLLTESAPVTVINPSLTDVVYLASDSNVTPGNGAVPVAPGTAYVWQTPGTLYGITTGAAVTVILTGSSDAWQPSPVAIGAAIGAQLAAQGIVTSLTITPLGSYTIPYQGLQGTFSLTIDTAARGLPPLSSFGSLLLVLVAGGTGGAVTPVSYQWIASGGAGVVAGPNLLPLNFGGGGGSAPSVTPIIPVMGETLNIRNPNTAPMSVQVFGYNERVAPAAVVNGASMMGFTAKASYAVGGTGFAQMVITSGEYFQGPAQCYAYIQYGASHALDANSVITLSFNGISDLYNIIGSAQFAAATATTYEAYFNRSFPAAPFQLSAHLGGGVTATVPITFVLQAIPYQ